MNKNNKRSMTCVENDQQRPKKSRQNGSETQTAQTNGFTENGMDTNNDTVPVEADVGIIENIYLQNFMCHSKLEFSFGPNVNFICGRNGSGKSAILTGLVLGLGGKANITNRGSNIKSFIKTGKTAAVIKVQLRNRGPDAYKGEIYGEKLSVERRISSDGTSSYKIRDFHNNIIATKKDELQHIIDQFNIQVGNPVSVLNQETSRNFLNSKSPQDKYTFFLKATQLEEIRSNYGIACEKKRKAKNLILQKRQLLPALEKEMLERERIYRTYLCLEDQRNKVKELRREFSWAVVRENEQTFETKEAEFKEAESKVPYWQEKANKCRENIEKGKELRAGLKLEVENIQQQLNEQTPLLAEMKMTMLKSKQQLRQVQLDQSKIKHEIRTTESEIKTFADRILELKSVNENDGLEEKRIRLEKISELETQLSEQQAQQKTNDNHYHHLEQSINHIQNKLSNDVQEERSLNSKLRSLQTELQNLESSRTNRLMRFGQYMPNLLKAIDQAYQAGKFSQKPRGPIGALVTMRDQQWALAVEMCLQRLLTSFCCDNYRDEKVLLEIFKRVIPHNVYKPTVIVSKFLHVVHDIRKTAVQNDQHPGVLDVLDIEDPVVANCCIDQRSVESVILIKDPQVARNVMMRAVPRNCNEAFTLSGDQLFHSPTFRFYSSRKLKAQYLTENIEEKVAETREEIGKMEETYRKITAALHASKRNLSENQCERDKAKTRVTKIGQLIVKLNAEINKLKNIEDPSPTDVTALEDDLAQYEEKKRNLMEQLDAIDEKKVVIEAERSKAENDYALMNEKFSKVSSGTEPLVEKIQQCEEDFERNKSIHQKTIQRLKEYEKKTGTLGSALELTKLELKNLTEMALKVGERVETRRASRVIESEINQIDKELQHKERQNGNKEQVTVRYMEAKKKFSLIKKQIDDIEQIISSIDKGLVKRMSAYKNFRNKIVVRLKVLFLTALMVRKYTGKLEFDHQQKSLNIFVQPSERVEELHHDMRSLSGGERSFSTVCFILALWDAMESPFRILDEYDVFMDMVNRRISMGLMLDTAQQNLHHQFIFLTPLDMPVTRVSPIIRISLMPDPIRENAALIEDAENEDDNPE